MNHGAVVVAYFADDPTRTYQLRPWLPVLEALHERYPVALVLRDPASADLIAGRTGLPLHLAVSLHDLTELYAELDAKVALYCNNSMLNFSSLISSRMLHVHVNHGESDKQSMASNNAKAYDRVFVAGPAAVERYAAELLEFDADRLVRVGRPQLDLPPEPLLEPLDQHGGRRTVLYAPTWEGDAEYNDYTSLDTLGPAVVAAATSLPGVRVVYKPHPQVLTSTTPRIAAAHAAVVDLVAEAGRRDPEAGHRSILRGDILAVVPSGDALVADVSAVGPDWLYLRTDKPLFLTSADTPLSRCADVLTEPDVEAIAALLRARLDHDEHRLARTAMRHHYFGDLQVGDSAPRFLDAVAELIALRDRLLDGGRITA